MCPACRQLEAHRSGQRTQWWLAVAVVAEAAALAGLWRPMTEIIGAVAIATALVPLHEAGHATAAVIVRFRVVRIALGVGPVAVRRRWAGTSVEVRAYPCGGHTLAVPRSPRWYRLRFWSVVAGGPLASAATLAAGWTLLRSAPGGSAAALLGYQIAFVSIGLLVVNLFPWSTGSGGARAGSDGWQLLTVPFLSRSDVEHRLRMSSSIPFVVAMEAGDHDEATSLLAAAEAAGATVEPEIEAQVHLNARRWADAIPFLRLAVADQPAATRRGAACRSNLAWCLLHLGTEDDLREADHWSAEACDATEWEPQVSLTRGAVLRALGRPEEALPYLRRAEATASAASNRAAAGAEIARCLAATSDVVGARKALVAAARRDPGNPALEDATWEVRRSESRAFLRAGWDPLPVSDEEARTRLRQGLGSSLTSGARSVGRFVDTSSADDVLTLVREVVPTGWSPETDADPVAWLRGVAADAVAAGRGPEAGADAWR